MDKLKQFSNIDPLEKSKRMARCLTRMVQPVPKKMPESQPSWTTCPIKGCTSIFSRERDLNRHRYESHRDTLGFKCLHCTSTYKRQHTLNLHTRRFHPSSLIKKVDSSTQTVLYKVSDTRITTPLEIKIGFIDPKNNTVTGNRDSSNLLLLETDLKVVSKKHEADKKKIRKTCEFKRKNIKIQKRVSTISEQTQDILPPPEKVLKVEKNSFLDSIFALDNTTTKPVGQIVPQLLDMPTFDLNFFNNDQKSNYTTNMDIPQTPQQFENIATTSDYLLDPHDSNIVSIAPINNSQSSSSSSSISSDSAANLLQETILRGDLAVSPSSSCGSLDEINLDYLSPPQTEEEFMNLMIELNS